MTLFAAIMLVVISPALAFDDHGGEDEVRFAAVDDILNALDIWIVR